MPYPLPRQVERGRQVRERIAAIVARDPDTWTVKAVAAELGLDEQTIYSHMRKLGIVPPRSLRLKPSTIERNARAAAARARRESQSPAPVAPAPPVLTLREAAAACAAEIELRIGRRA